MGGMFVGLELWRIEHINDCLAVPVDVITRNAIVAGRSKSMGKLVPFLLDDV